MLPILFFVFVIVVVRMGAVRRRGGKNSKPIEQLNKRSSSSKKQTNVVTSAPPPKVKRGRDEELSEEEIDNDSSSAYQTESEGEEGLSENSDTSSGSGSSMEDDIINTEKQKGYSDDNATWLKLKQHQEEKEELLSSSSGSSSEDEEDEEEEEEEEEILMDIERKSKQIEEEMELERLEAEEEMRHVIATQTSVFHLPTPEELETDKDRVVPTAEIRNRIQDILQVLADFKNRREPGRSRTEYIEQYQRDLAELYGYIPELAEMFLDHFGPSETLEFMEASDKPRPLVLRVNTLKARRKDLAASLLKRGVNLDPLAPWSKVGLKIYDSPIPIGATPEYLAGHYMLQSASSMCPVIALSPFLLTDRVLDMSAAPGGKTSYIAQLMKNTGTIIANDLRPDRQKATMANLARLGVRNTIVCHHDGRKLGTLMKNYFDKVLLDSPCSGLGVISRDPSVKVQRTVKDILRTVVLQKELILSAIDSLKLNGFLVYSTCSVCIHENEEVVNYALTRRNIKIIDTGLSFGKPGFTRYKDKRFHPSLELTRRFYPHVHNMDGFYVAKIQKIGHHNPAVDTATSTPVEGEKEEGTNQTEDLLERPNTKQHKQHKQKPMKRKANQNVRSITKKSHVVKEIPKKKATNAKVTKPRRTKVNATSN